MPYLIDGYNLLRSIQKTDEELCALTDTGLCRILCEYFRRVRSFGHIVFDGIGPPDKSGFSGLDNLEIYFSGTDIDADEIIEERIGDNTAPKSLIVVSTDRKIRASAAKRKAVAVRSDIFWQNVIQQLGRHRKPTPEPQEKRTGITESETDEWLDLFGIEEN